VTFEIRVFGSSHTSQKHIQPKKYILVLVDAHHSWLNHGCFAMQYDNMATFSHYNTRDVTRQEETGGKKNQHCFLRHFHSWLAINSDSAHAAEPRSRQCLPPPRIDAAKQRSRTTPSVPPPHRRTKRLRQFLLRIDGTGIAKTPQSCPEWSDSPETAGMVWNFGRYGM
jgi:hypothetical protein